MSVTHSTSLSVTIGHVSNPMGASMEDQDREAVSSPTITVELDGQEARALINAANLLIDTLAAISDGTKIYALVTAAMKLETSVLIAEGE